jgi:signal transduction histidine kinase
MVFSRVRLDAARRIPLVCAVLVGAIALIVLLSWALDFHRVLALGPDGVTMIPAAAVCFLLGAASLAIASRGPQRDAVRLLQQLLALVMLLIAATEFAEYFIQPELGIDLLLFRDKVIAAPWRPAGRIAINSAAALMFYGLALLSLNHDFKKRGLRSQSLAAGGLLIALLAFLGYIFGVRRLYAMSVFTGMAPLAVIAHLCLGAGIVFAQRERGLGALITDDGAAGAMTRRLLPAAIIVPILLGSIRIAGEKAGFYDTQFGVSLFAAASILTFASLVVWAARVLRALDRDRSELVLREQQTRAAAERARMEAETARAEAERANTIKTDFLAVMSHELRTPLTAIMGYEELLSDGITGPVTDLQRQQLGRINASAHHLLGLIDEVLTFARVDVGRENVNLDRVDLNTIVGEAAALVEPMAAGKGIRFVVVNLQESLIVETDRTKLKQMLVNLLSNAIKFTDEGEVRFTVAIRKDSMEFCVTDTGIGIDSANVEAIFEPFWQVEQGATRKVGGAGLGLSVTRKLARLLGGDVTVRTGVGVGSTFTLSLPLTPPARSEGRKKTPGSMHALV